MIVTLASLALAFAAGIVVGSVFSLGSTSATELCEQYGFDPNQKVRNVK